MAMPSSTHPILPPSPEILIGSLAMGAACHADISTTVLAELKEWTLTTDGLTST